MAKSKTNGRAPDITMDEWMAEMERLGGMGVDDEGMSLREIQKTSGRSKRLVQDNLRVLKDEGRLIVGRRAETRIDGRACTVPVYSIKPKK